MTFTANNNNSALSSMKIERPTLMLFIAAYASWMLLVALHSLLPLVLVVPALICLVTLHSSLQHEVIHGHPSNNSLLNNALAFPAIGLFIPFERYELLHLQHHRNWLVTDPLDDSESYFLAQTQWEKCNQLIKKILNFNNTLVGRLLIGPAIMLVRMCVSESAQFKHADVRNSWLMHIPAIALALIWLWLFNFSILFYIIAIAYPATSLLMLRSYSEHLPEENIDHRSAIVKSNRFMQLLYLNNNFHRVHHDHPEVVWYDIPKMYQQHYANQNLHVYPGYLYLLKHFGFKQRYPVEHPFLAKR